MRALPRLSAGRRAGISLLEVVFSIGVVIIGLLGVVALLPLAAKRAGDGVTADRMTYYGKSAVEEFRLRGMRRTDTWCAWFPDTTLISGSTIGKGVYPLLRPGQVHPTHGQWFPINGVWWYSPAVGQSFCIDPRFVVANAGSPGATYNPQYFPYYVQSSTLKAFDARLARITLKANAGNPRVAMGAVQAFKVFASGDALDIDFPADRSLPSQQRFIFDAGPDGEPGDQGIDDDGNNVVDDYAEMGWSGSDDIPLERASEGKLSWLATLVPKFDRSGEFYDLYTLSIAVLKNRDGSMAMNSGRVEVPNNERLADVVFTGGPEVRLVTVGTSRGAADLDLNDHDWIMLGAATVSSQNPALAGPSVFRWYRIIATDNEPVRWTAGSDGDWGVSGTDDDGDGIVDNTREAGSPGSDDDPNSATGPFIYTRYATVDGPDWDRPEWLPGGRWIAARGIRAFRPTRATLMNGVVTVYEKTIRLESTSLWGP